MPTTPHDTSLTLALTSRPSARPANVSLKQLRGFAAVAREGSFTRAAAALFLSQSALSALIRGLESELGLRLFDRTTRRLEMTDAARELMPAVQRLLADLDRVAGDLRDVAQRRRGRVRLGTTPLLAASLMPQLLRSFQQHYPDIELSLLDASADVLLGKLRLGELDLALATFDAREPDIESEALTRDAMVAVCSQDHFLAGRAHISWAELLDQPLLLLREGSGLRALVERCFAPLGGCPKPAQEVTHIATAMAMAAADMGVAILPAYALHVSVLHAATQGGLVGVPLRQPAVSREVSLAHLQQRSLSPAAQAMAEHLRQHLAQATQPQQGAGATANNTGDARQAVHRKKAQSKHRAA
ncbi:LysR family transcriptional regulator [Roseateles koreensis]|uniref:LysR substrate-binding domain-containing protein n=1 Tax=Roseateles koreensis TaxID=2987526 RepID=A0ABT5KU16_9BURK|nr:LysR substrate-binding domain-containing protein [Roseateles koreensis]MDC8785257.1 LysR substrate-binding domain-containing protein [Roseateles koreensis]